MVGGASLLQLRTVLSGAITTGPVHGGAAAALALVSATGAITVASVSDLASWSVVTGATVTSGASDRPLSLSVLASSVTWTQTGNFTGPLSVDGDALATAFVNTEPMLLTQSTGGAAGPDLHLASLSLHFVKFIVANDRSAIVDGACSGFVSRLQVQGYVGGRFRSRLAPHHAAPYRLRSAPHAPHPTASRRFDRMRSSPGARLLHRLCARACAACRRRAVVWSGRQGWREAVRVRGSSADVSSFHVVRAGPMSLLLCCHNAWTARGSGPGGLGAGRLRVVACRSSAVISSCAATLVRTCSCTTSAAMA